jgi:Leucine-rich repeat (LRR) protein
MKKAVLYFSLFAFMGFIISCGGTSTSNETEVNETKVVEEQVKSAPLKTAEELREIPKVDEITIKDAENKEEFIRLSTSYSLTELPVEVFEAINLQTIELNNFNGTSLPEGLKNLPNLTVLYISGGTKLEKLPDFLPEIKNLKTISISAATKIDLNEAFTILSKCENLENVQINFSKVPSELPAEIGNMKKLKVLDLDQNIITKFPAEFFTLPNLQALYINSPTDNRYDYDMLFNELKNLPNLQSLSIQYTGLTSLPEVLREYPSLSTFYWREEGKGWEDSDAILNTVDKMDKKFPEFTVSWNAGRSLFYDRY